MGRSIALLLAICGVAAAAAPDTLRVVRRERLDVAPWTAAERRWIREHVGLIFYDDGTDPRFTFTEQIDLAHALGLSRVKTWLKGSRPGEMVERLSLPHYQRLLAEFDTILFDVCPDFMLVGAYDAEKARTIRQEYEAVAYHLAATYAGQPKTFLLSLFMETNLFFGSERAHHPDFPADRFFEDATEGVQAGLRRARAERAGEQPRVYTVIEVAHLPRDFIRRYLPRTRADLYALSYYGRGELGQPDCTLAECIREVAAAVPHNGPFGRRNLILGELGRSVFAGGNRGEDREQLQYLRRTLATARAAQMPYAFIFWLTDQERSPDDGWGFITSKKAGGRLRRAWHAFQQAFGGRFAAPRGAAPLPVVDAIRPLDPNPPVGRPTRVEVDVANRSTWDADAAPARDVVVRLTAGNVERRATLSLAPEELVTLRATVPAPADARVTVTLTAAGHSSEPKEASLDCADLVVDRVYTEPAAPKPGDPVRLFAVVRNRGNQPITDFAVHFHVDDFKALWNTWGCIYGETRLAKDEALPIGGGFLWTATPGKHRIRAWANPDGGRESNCRNNLGWTTIRVSAPAAAPRP